MSIMALDEHCRRCGGYHPRLLDGQVCPKHPLEEWSNAQKDVLYAHIRNKMGNATPEERSKVLDAYIVLKKVDGIIIDFKDDSLDPERFIKDLPTEDYEQAKLLIKYSPHAIDIPYLVRTPVPYVVCLRHHKYELERIKAAARLDECVNSLSEILRLLKFDKERAVKAGYTLNLKTKEELTEICEYSIEHGINVEDTEKAMEYLPKLLGRA